MKSATTSDLISLRVLLILAIYLHDNCYNLRLGLGCNLDKGLSKREEKIQLVKHKDTGLYL